MDEQDFLVPRGANVDVGLQKLEDGPVRNVDDRVLGEKFSCRRVSGLV